MSLFISSEVNVKFLMEKLGLKVETDSPISKRNIQHSNEIPESAALIHLGHIFHIQIAHYADDSTPYLLNDCIRGIK